MAGLSPVPRTRRRLFADEDDGADGAGGAVGGPGDAPRSPEGGIPMMGDPSAADVLAGLATVPEDEPWQPGTEPLVPSPPRKTPPRRRSVSGGVGVGGGPVSPQRYGPVLRAEDVAEPGESPPGKSAGIPATLRGLVPHLAGAGRRRTSSDSGVRFADRARASSQFSDSAASDTDSHSSQSPRPGDLSPPKRGKLGLSAKQIMSLGELPPTPRGASSPRRQRRSRSSGDFSALTPRLTGSPGGPATPLSVVVMSPSSAGSSMSPQRRMSLDRAQSQPALRVAMTPKTSNVMSVIQQYVPQMVLRELQDDPDPEVLSSRAHETIAAVLFADISGFTALSEKLAQEAGAEGAEQITSMLNRYFDQIVNCIQTNDGDVIRFAGDALLAAFPAWEQTESLRELTERARTAGDQLIASVLDTPPTDSERDIGQRISLRVGIGAGDIASLHLGGVGGRWEFVILGEPVVDAYQAEASAERGTVALAPSAQEALLEFDELDSQGTPPETNSSRSILDIYASVGSTGSAASAMDGSPVRSPMRSSQEMPPQSPMRSSQELLRSPMRTSSQEALAPHRVSSPRRIPSLHLSFAGGGILPPSPAGSSALLQRARQDSGDDSGGLLGTSLPESTTSSHDSLEHSSDVAKALRAYLPSEVVKRLAHFESGLCEIRTITVVFVRIEGIDVDKLQLDFEAARDSLQKALSELQTSFHTHEGSTNKFMIDDKGIVLLGAFGLPSLTHENDCVRAVLCASDVRDRLARCGMGGSVGITTGQCYCGPVGGTKRREYTMIGDLVNLASRLMTSAGGDVLADTATFKRAQVERIVWQPLQAIHVKGKRAPIPVFRPSVISDSLYSASRTSTRSRRRSSLLSTLTSRRGSTDSNATMGSESSHPGLAMNRPNPLAVPLAATAPPELLSRFVPDVLESGGSSNVSSAFGTPEPPRRPGVPPHLAGLHAAAMDPSVGGSMGGRGLPSSPFDNPLSHDSVASKSSAQQFTSPLASSRAPQGASEVKIVGREEVWEQLDNVLHNLVTGEGGAVVLIHGAEGLGKTVLAEETIGAGISMGLRVLFGSGDSIERNTAYSAWARIFCSLLGIERGMGPEDVEQMVGVLFNGDEAMTSLVPLLECVLPIAIPDNATTAVLHGRDRARATNRLLVALVSKYAAVGNAQPHLVIVLDDLQWVDSQSRELAIDIGLHCGDALLLLLLLRPRTATDAAELKEALTSGCDSHEHGACADAESKEAAVVDIKLEPLSRDEQETMIKHFFRVEEVPSSITDVVCSAAQGNPYFVEELCQSLYDSRVVTVSGPECFLSEQVDINDVRIPRTIEGVVMSRLDALTPAQQLTVKVAAVIGLDFSVRTLLFVHPMTPSSRSSVVQSVKELVSLELLTMNRGSQTHYCFTHATTHEIAYGMLLFSQRRELHAKVAAYYEKKFAEHRELYIGVIARHWTLSGHVDKACHTLELAGNRALRIDAMSEACNYFSTALLLARHHNDVLVEHGAESMPSPTATGSMGGTPGTSPKGLGTRDGGGDGAGGGTRDDDDQGGAEKRLSAVASEDMARWERSLGIAKRSMVSNMAMLEESEMHLVRALELLDFRLPEWVGLRLLWETQRATWHIVVRLLPRSVQERLYESRPDARSLELARILLELHVTHELLGNVPRATLDLLTALNRCAVPLSVASAEQCQAYAAMATASNLWFSPFCGYFRRKSGEVLSELDGDLDAMVTQQIWLGQLFCGTGRFNTAVELLGEAVSTADKHQLREAHHRATFFQAVAMYLRGDLSEAGGIFEAGLKVSSEHRDRLAQTLCLLGVAQTSLELGDTEKAAATLAQAEDRIDERVPTPFLWARILGAVLANEEEALSNAIAMLNGKTHLALALIGPIDVLQHHLLVQAADEDESRAMMALAQRCLGQYCKFALTYPAGMPLYLVRRGQFHALQGRRLVSTWLWMAGRWCHGKLESGLLAHSIFERALAQDDQDDMHSGVFVHPLSAREGRLMEKVKAARSASGEWIDEAVAVLILVWLVFAVVMEVALFRWKAASV